MAVWNTILLRSHKQATANHSSSMYLLCATLSHDFTNSSKRQSDSATSNVNDSRFSQFYADQSWRVKATSQMTPMTSPMTWVALHFFSSPVTTSVPTSLVHINCLTQTNKENPITVVSPYPVIYDFSLNMCRDGRKLEGSKGSWLLLMSVRSS